jgi:pilus assembly protein CpaF
MNSASIHPGFRLILPYLRQIENLILDPEISEIMINSPSNIFIEKQGVMERVLGVTIPADQLRVAVQNIARSLGDDISEEKPILDSRLPDGSRIAAVLPPCSIHGITLTIRKFNTKHFTIADLIHIGTLTEGMAADLEAAIAGRKNILISGGTGTGRQLYSISWPTSFPKKTDCWSLRTQLRFISASQTLSASRPAANRDPGSLL